MPTNQRPAWAEENDLMRDYYDHYWGFPLHDDRRLFELLSLEVFQAGLSWQTVWQRRPGFERAFFHFDIGKVAAMDHDDYLRLLANSAIIRNRRKITTTIHNARAAVRIYLTAGRGFADYCWELVGRQAQPSPVGPGGKLPAKNALSIRISRQLRRDGLTGLGPVATMSFLCAAGMIDVRHQKS